MLNLMALYNKWRKNMAGKKPKKVVLTCLQFRFLERHYVEVVRSSWFPAQFAPNKIACYVDNLFFSIFGCHLPENNWKGS